MRPQRVMFFSFFPLESRAPTGAAKYNLHHMGNLARIGHECLMVCRLTSGSRKQSLSRLRADGITVSSEELSWYAADRFRRGPLQFATFTFQTGKGSDKSARPVRLVKRLSRFFGAQIRPRSPFYRHNKNFFQILLTAIRHGSGPKERLLMCFQWLVWRVFMGHYYSQVLDIHLVQTVREFKPTYLFVDADVNTIDFALKTRDYAPDLDYKVVPVVSMVYQVPFGPLAVFAPENRAIVAERVVEVFQQVDAFVASSRYLKDYLVEWNKFGQDVGVVYPPVGSLGEGGFDGPPRPNRGFVTLINSCNEKGQAIFLELAKRFPQVPFAAVLSWGQKRRQRQELEKLPNVQVLKAMSPVDPIYDMTRILLVPSLMEEGFGMVVIEAMSRGIPVLASDTGGLREAKLGVEYSLPVQQPVDARRVFDRPPPQDIGPWLKALEELLSSDELYARISQASKEAVRDFARQTSEATLLQDFEPDRPGGRPGPGTRGDEVTLRC